MRVTVDETMCEASGFCESLAPDVFELGDADVVQIADGPVPSLRTDSGGTSPGATAASTEAATAMISDGVR